MLLLPLYRSKDKLVTAEVYQIFPKWHILPLQLVVLSLHHQSFAIVAQLAGGVWSDVAQGTSLEATLELGTNDVSVCGASFEH